MPFTTLEKARQYSEYYGASIEQLKDERRKAFLQQRIDSFDKPIYKTSITSDNRGFLVSFEDPIAFGKADETEFEQITIQIKEKRFNERYRKAVDIEFKEFINLEE